ncbi:MAG: GNAT family N-acetyltransferase [Flavobacteriales bacterium]|nr:GNAT family N-acetyltransferase [Flavobacteriales bacterium]
MKVVEVKSSTEKTIFLNLVHKIYENDPNWVCPLDKDITIVFNLEGNTYFKHGKAIRWILLDDSNNPIGRIAAFIDFNTSLENDQPTGGIGFFECVDNQEAAKLLFDEAKNWLVSQDIEAMDGPINFGESDKYWGLLVDGFTQPAYKIAYNPPYYRELFEEYGFQVYYKQEGFHLDLSNPIPERFYKIAERVVSNPEYSFEHFDYNQINKYVSDFTHVYNLTWKDFRKDFEPVQEAYILKFMKDAKIIIEEKFIWFAYKNGVPIAIYFMYPDANQILKEFDGKLGFWNKLKLLYHVNMKKITRARGMVMGVVPEFHGKGIESAFYIHVNNVFKEMPHYNQVEFSWVGDFNPLMRKLWKAMGADPAKSYITYRYLFDRDKDFVRYPIPSDKKE